MIGCWSPPEKAKVVVVASSGRFERRSMRSGLVLAVDCRV